MDFASQGRSQNQSLTNTERCMKPLDICCSPNVLAILLCGRTQEPFNLVADWSPSTSLLYSGITIRCDCWSALQCISCGPSVIGGTIEGVMIPSVEGRNSRASSVTCSVPNGNKSGDLLRGTEQPPLILCLPQVTSQTFRDIIPASVPLSWIDR